MSQRTRSAPLFVAGVCLIIGSFVVSAQEPPNPADINGDGVVNAIDLALVLGGWGNPGCGGVVSCPGDVSGDGVVNAFDLALVLGSWGQA